MVDTAVPAVIDTYYEDFDDRQDDTTIDGVDGTWSVEEGEASDAITQDSTTYEGTGNALELIGAETAVNVSDAKSFDRISPTWLEFIVKPGVGAQARTLPTGKIAAVTFDHTGKIYASDGSSWTDTGETFTSDEWYRVILKLDFSNHLYDIYISAVDTPDVMFIPDKQNLGFIDTSIDSMSYIKFGGVYNPSRTDDDSYIDNLIVHFIEKLEIITTSQTITEDQPSGHITVQLQNALSETQTAWRDITLELHSTSDSGEFSLDKDAWQPVTQLIIPENAQEATFYYKDGRAGSPIITVSEYPDRGWDDALQQEEIISEVAAFDVSAVTPQTAGEYFNILITAKDEEGNVNETYTGEIEILVNYISPDSGAMGIAPQTASGFNGGILELSAVYPDCGMIEITVVDAEDISKTGNSGEILFLPANFGVTCETPQVTGTEFPLTVTAYNAQNEVTPNYQRPVMLEIIPISPADILEGVLSPATIIGNEFINGGVERDVIYDRWGTIKIKAYDEGYPARAGTGEAIEFRPDSLLIEVKAPSEERDFFYIGENIEITMSVVDGEGNPIPNYFGSLIISSTVGLTMPQGYIFVETDGGSHIFISSSDSTGTYIVGAEEEESGLTAQSPSIEVKSATLIVDDTESPLGTTEVIIYLVDEEGNVITSENDLTITIELEEENSNSSASSPASTQAVTLQNGRAIVLVSNTEPEFVTITPRSAYKFKIKKGTVKFGRIAKTGIGVLMWREIKD